MIEILPSGTYLIKGQVIIEDKSEQLTVEEANNRLTSAGLEKLEQTAIVKEHAKAGTIAYRIMTGHNESGNMQQLKLRFDALTSHDITYVGIVQTACASGLKEFPVPYVLTNCHNSLCAVGGTINEDDHIFGLSAAKKFGGIFVPTHQAVIHQYMREMLAGCGKMILGSDSHTRYGALGTMAIGEGGGELVKQLVKRTYDIAYPEVIAVYLEGKPVPGVGPQDVALAIIGAVFKTGFVKNKVLEFVGPGIDNLTVDFRNGIDVMTTETTCLSSIWCTDEQVAEYYRIHGRPEEYKKLAPDEVSYYDGMVKVDLNCIRPMIALPFHPSNVWSIEELNQNGLDILRLVEIEGQKQLENPNLQLKLTNKLVNGRLQVDQAVVAGCAGGTFENIIAMAQILGQQSIGVDAFSLSVYPSSQPVAMELINNKTVETLMLAGATIRTAFCGPCFGAGDVPVHNGFSIRHTTRNFPNREGSKPDSGQIASVALMDARSIAATARNGGRLTPATEVGDVYQAVPYRFNEKVYENRIYQGFCKAQPEQPLVFGPNIANWPKIRPLTSNLLLKIASVIHDPVTTTDELIPSGETSSYRSNPYKLAEFTLSRKDPAYVDRAKTVQIIETKRQQAVNEQVPEEVAAFFRNAFLPNEYPDDAWQKLIRSTGVGTVIFARKPGDGSAREQAASCQRVLGGDANIALEYATKRYRSNLINWGMLPFTISEVAQDKLAVDSYIYIPGIREAVQAGAETVNATVITDNGTEKVLLKLENISSDDRDIILAGCLMNYYNR
ncbi:aconitate hydratase [Anaerospora hongkongensis]|uniref:Aconitate hydratase n=1 Tax=Anaerospora hongkongensis TaxID=244830 RepID=A0A4R1Q456_9FIRM|nr:hydratase [Anaerospora hongkongensis]TCL39844.1 aconitate hydratase [Anaerospora hongkongensis]